jgi:hypothetical protein
MLIYLRHICWDIIKIWHPFLQTVNIPMVPSIFLHLKLLTIVLRGHTYDYFSLLSFLVASPSLETFILNVSNY